MLMMTMNITIKNEHNYDDEDAAAINGDDNRIEYDSEDEDGDANDRNNNSKWRSW